MAAAADVNPSSLTAMLHAGAYLYGAGVKLKNAGYDAGVLAGRTLPCRVISIGNIVAGGTGKTPMTIHVVNRLKQMGRHPVVLSRGYGGKAEKKGIVVSDGYEIFSTPDIAGDEPFMMASKLRGVPVIVGGDRYKSGMRAVSEFDPDIIVLDDGFQHRRLQRNMDLVLVDADNMFGNGYLIPRGMLREQVSGLGRSGAIILTRCRDDCKSAVDAMRRQLVDILPRNRSEAENKPIFRTDHVSFLSGIHDGSAPLSADIPLHTVEADAEDDFSSITHAAVFVFSGIARNRDFLTVIENNGGHIVGHRAYPDHHQYTDTELGEIVGKAMSMGADFLVTTEKDYVRIAGKMPGGLPIAVIGVKIRFKGDDEAAFVRFIRRQLTAGV